MHIRVCGREGEMESSVCTELHYGRLSPEWEKHHHRPAVKLDIFIHTHTQTFISIRKHQKVTVAGFSLSVLIYKEPIIIISSWQDKQRTTVTSVFGSLSFYQTHSSCCEVTSPSSTVITPLNARYHRSASGGQSAAVSRVTTTDASSNRQQQYSVFFRTKDEEACFSCRDTATRSK